MELLKHLMMRRKKGQRRNGQHGLAAVELALILPILITITFVIIDFGRLIQARLVVTNVAREGGSLASRDIQSAGNLIMMLQAAASPLNLAGDGRIYIWKIRAGTTAHNPDPFIDTTVSANAGALSVASSIGTGQPNLGLSLQLYSHLEFDNSPGKKTSDISEVTVVEVFYRVTPITPIGKFVPTLFAGGSAIVASKAVF
jgi:hypothetical protein